MSSWTSAAEAIVTMRGKRSPAAVDRNDASGRANWLLCRAGAHLHAISIEHVSEVMRVLPIEAVSGSPQYVCGVCVIRGAPVPVVDIGLLVGGKATRIQRLVTIRTGVRAIALAAETVVGIRNFGTETPNQFPPLLGDAAHQAIEAIGTLDADLLFFLRAARIVPQDVLDGLGIPGASS